MAALSELNCPVCWLGKFGVQWLLDSCKYIGRIASLVGADATTIQIAPLLFGGICIQRLKVVQSLRLVDTEQSLGP